MSQVFGHAVRGQKIAKIASMTACTLVWAIRTCQQAACFVTSSDWIRVIERLQFRSSLGVTSVKNIIVCRLTSSASSYLS